MEIIQGVDMTASDCQTCAGCITDFVKSLNMNPKKVIGQVICDQSDETADIRSHSNVKYTFKGTDPKEFSLAEGKTILKCRRSN